jgi:hypothetical protein
VARQYKAWLGTTSLPRQGKTRLGMEWLGKARQGKAEQGKAMRI